MEYCNFSGVCNFALFMTMELKFGALFTVVIKDHHNMKLRNEVLHCWFTVSNELVLSVT